MFTQDMHHIRKEIIASLAFRSPQRFTQLQPAELPNNTFSYHLKKLIQSGYVVLTDDGYIATRKALKTLQYDVPPSKRSGTPAMITVLYVTNDKGQTLLLQRTKRPFVGWYGVPSGLVHQDEHIGQAAQRELREKTTLEAPDLSFVGTLDFKYLEKDSGDLFVHAVAFVYAYHVAGDSDYLSRLETKYGTLLWSDLSDDRILPEVRTIADIAQRKQSVLVSVDYDEPAMTWIV